MKIIKILFSTVLLLCMTVSAIAADMDSYEIDDVKVSMTITGTPAGGYYGKPVSIEILTPKGSIADNDKDYDMSNIAKDFVYMNQIPLSKDGSYKIIVDMTNRDGGFYTVRVNGKEVEQKIFYTTLSEKLDLLDEFVLIMEFDKAVAISEIKTTLDSTNKESLIFNTFNISDELVTKVNPDTLAEALYTQLSADDAILSDVTKFKNALIASVHAAALNEGKGNILAYEKEFGLDSDYVELYTKELKDDVKVSFVKDYFKDKKLFLAKDIAERFEVATLIGFTKSMNSVSDAELLVEKYGEDTGIDVKEYGKLKTQAKTKLYNYIVKESPFESLEVLADKVNAKIKELSKEKDSSGGSSGGGMGGSGGGVSTSQPIYTNTINAVYKFSDMVGYEWANPAVENLSRMEIVSGVGDDNFAPARQITREEMLTMLLRAYGINPQGENTAKFSDVASDAWYASYVAKGIELGVTNGISDTEFGTGKYITRQEAAAMACRIAESFGANFNGAVDAFSDDCSIAPWAKDSVYKLKNAKVINGVGDGSFAPASTCTRAEAAVIIYALINI